MSIFQSWSVNNGPDTFLCNAKYGKICHWTDVIVCLAQINLDTLTKWVSFILIHTIIGGDLRSTAISCTDKWMVESYACILGGYSQLAAPKKESQRRQYSKPPISLCCRETEAFVRVQSGTCGDMEEQVTCGLERRNSVRLFLDNMIRSYIHSYLSLQCVLQ